MIKLEGVSKSYQGKTVLDRFDLEIPSKGITTISGPSGCGKTTLLRLILGLEKADEGQVISPIEQYSVVFEDDSLLPWLNVEENVSLVLKNKDERVRLALESVGLGDHTRVDIGDLSGGMKRRVAIARALAFGGGCLVLDEPTIRLDDELGRCVMTYIRESWKDKPVIMVTHDQAIAREFSDCVYRVEGAPLKVNSTISNCEKPRR